MIVKKITTGIKTQHLHVVAPFTWGRSNTSIKSMYIPVMGGSKHKSYFLWIGWRLLMFFMSHTITRMVLMNS